jgi:hypothetical protein
MPLRIAHAASFLEIDAGTECLVAGAGENDAAPGVGLRAEAGEDIEEIAARLSADGVAHLRPVDPCHHDRIGGLLDLQRLVAAAEASCGRWCRRCYRSYSKPR